MDESVFSLLNYGWCAFYWDTGRIGLLSLPFTTHSLLLVCPDWYPLQGTQRVGKGLGLPHCHTLLALGLSLADILEKRHGWWDRDHVCPFTTHSWLLACPVAVVFIASHVHPSCNPAGHDSPKGLQCTEL